MLFPSSIQFQPIPFQGSVLFDHIGDINPKETDIVGTTQFPAAYYAFDGTHAFFRLRLNADPRLKTGFTQFAWGLLFETDGNPATYEWVLAIDGLNERLDLIKNTHPIPNTWNDPAEGTDGKGTPNFSLPIINYDIARVTVADSNFDGDPDYFLDFFIASSTLFSFLGITAATQIRTLFFTATNNNNYNKDSLQFNEGYAFQNASSDLLTFNQADVRAKLSVKKRIVSGPTTITAGQISTWTEEVNVTNTGKSTATTIFVQIPLKTAQTGNVQITSTSIGTAVYAPLTQILSWNIGNLAAGASATLLFTFSGTLQQTGQHSLDEVTVTGVDSFTGGNTPIASDQITITSNAQPTTGNISGLIIDQATGLPLPGATVTLLDAGNNPVASTVSNGGGSYGFSNITPGSYTVTATLTNYSLGSATVQVSAGTGTTQNVLVSPLPATVNGTVTGQGSGPLQGAVVRLINSLGVETNSTTTDAAGFYSFTGLLPMAYTLSVSFPNFQSETRAIILSANETQTDNFTLSPNPATVFGTVTNANSGATLAGVLVSVYTASSILISTTTTNGAGNYTINTLSPGAYRIQASIAGFSTSFLRVDVAAGSSQRIDFALQANAGLLSGSVTNADSGSPLASASIKVVSQEGITVAETQSALNGGFSVTGLFPGVYTVTIQMDGFASKTFSVIIESNQTTTLPVTLNQLAGTLSGTVLDTGGTPLADVTLRVYLNDTLIASTITEANGKYLIGNLAPGIYTTVAIADGFSRVSLGAIIQPFEETVQNFFLTPNTGTLVGRVTDQAGNPIAGAGLNVRTDISTGPIIARSLTDSEGRYTIPLLGPGTYVITVFATDYQTDFTGVTIRSDQETVVNFSLSPNPASIQGIITDINGTPITGGNNAIRVINSGGALVAMSFSDINGQYLFNQLAPGNYNVIVCAPGFQVAGGSVTLTPGEEETLNFQLFPNPGSIQGSVLSTSGTPLSGAILRITDKNGVLIAYTLADENGVFMVNELPPGEYTINAHANLFQNQIIGAIVNSDVMTLTQIVLQPNPGTLQGTVSPATNGTLVKMYTGDNIFLVTLVTDPNGHFFITGLAPGNYILTATQPGFITQRIGAIVNSDQTTTVAISLVPEPAGITGRITDTNGNPINQAVIRVLDLNETILATAFADSDGHYTLDGLPSGIRIIQVSAPSYKNIFDTVTLTPGNTLTGVNFTLQPNPGQINGHVSDEDTGDPISSATVFLRDSEGGIIGTVTTSLYGNYIFQDLTPGNYDVIASADGFETKIIGAPVISNMETGANVSLAPLPGAISGRIINEQGNPITGNNLQVRLFDNHNQLLRAIVAQSNGTFLFDNLRPDSYLINITVTGFVQNTASAIVVRNMTTPLTISLQKQPSTLTGQVVNRVTGQSISGSQLSLYNSNDNIVLAETVSGGDGRFLFNRLPEGSFNLTAAASGFGEGSIGVVLNIGETTQTDISLIPNPGSLFGFVTALDSGAAIPGATIRLYDPKGSFNAATPSNTQGEYLVSDLVPGTYIAIATASGFQSQLGGAIITSNQTTRLSFALSALPGAIDGTVTNAATSNSLSEASVKIRPFNSFGVSIDSILTDNQGQYEFTQLLPANYVLVFNKSNFNEVTNSGNVPRGDTITIDAALSPQQADNLPPTPSTPPTPPEPPFTPTPVSLATIEGTIRDHQTNQPLIDVKVDLFSFNQSLLFTTQTDENGFYRFSQLRLGEYTISTSNPGYQTASATRELTSSETETINLSLRRNPAQIEGTVRNQQNQAFIPGTTVQALDSMGVLVSETVTNGEGYFAMAGLTADRVSVTVSSPNFGSAAKSSNPDPGQTSRVDFLLTPLFGALRGTVRDERLEPIFNVRIQIFTDPSRPPKGSVKDTEPVLVRIVTTNAIGRYFVSNLAPGCYIGEYSFPNKGTAIRRFCLRAGETKVINVILFDGGVEEE
ncbi:carboxypeptidase regulatory-like domain-containing protein [Marininema halotolerans]|uniref:Carboxypeptidase regulatory-like domain-containing protein n=1 Tax=Marininema halotolerans TaxID=1155944 RepID=A0A1I6PTZ2_9BACL|nr:carboxypeptidase regulatory-like domain-containing protein [Marininema halotolerans]SFS43689.1 Carboxypeptidase regulatory-like domain-containing protein [Marininema halotolerans]